jgi:hypothetical protein
MPLYIPPAYPDLVKAVFFDDFITSTYNTRIWAVTGTGSMAAQDVVGGVMRIQATATFSYRMNHNNYGSFSIGNNAQIAWRGAMHPPTAGTGGLVECGFQTSTNPTTNYIRWQYLRGTTNFQCICTSGGTSTTTDSGTAGDTNNHEFRIECVTGQALFYLDGILKATITTNIPTGNLQPFANCTGSTTNVSYFDADWVDARGFRA